MITIGEHDISWLIWFLASGKSFFLGVFILLFAVLFSLVPKSLLRNVTILILAILSASLIFLSAAPLSGGFYILCLITTISWLILTIGPSLKKKAGLYIVMGLLFCLSITATIGELQFFVIPNMPTKSFETVYIIGDSISSGIGTKDEKTWPKILKNPGCQTDLKPYICISGCFFLDNIYRIDKPFLFYTQIYLYF